MFGGATDIDDSDDNDGTDAADNNYGISGGANSGDNSYDEAINDDEANGDDDVNNGSSSAGKASEARQSRSR